MCFQRWFNYYNRCTTGEDTSPNEEAGLCFPGQLDEIIAKGIIDETGLYLKKMPEQIYIQKRLKQCPNINRITVAGQKYVWVQTKMINRLENLHAFKNILSQCTTDPTRRLGLWHALCFRQGSTTERTKSLRDGTSWQSHPDVKAVCLPNLQPMDQGMIPIFKAYICQCHSCNDST